MVLFRVYLTILRSFTKQRVADLINTCYLYFEIHKACYHSFSQKGETVHIPLTRTQLISISCVVFYCWCSRDRAFSCDI